MALALVRRLVSKKKRRLQEDGFDLDLAYITDNTIAMGYPATGREAWYRNPLPRVVAFLEKRHKNQYRVYNLCSERRYDPSVFLGRVAHIPFDDHNVPTLGQMHEFCDDVARHTATGGVAVVHCKAGKGRTGVMICAHLVACGFATDAHDAMLRYGKLRTHDGKGVTIPSQRRYVEYFARTLAEGGTVPTAPTRRVRRIRVLGLPGDAARALIVVLSARDPTHLGTSELARFSMTSNAHEAVPYVAKLVDGDWHCEVKVQKDVGSALAINGDVRFEVYSGFVHKSRRLFHAWFNTCFLPISGAPVRLEGHSQLDKLKKNLRKRPVALELDIEPSDDAASVHDSALASPASAGAALPLPSALKNKRGENLAAFGAAKVKFEDGAAWPSTSADAGDIELTTTSRAMELEISLEESRIELEQLRDEKAGLEREMHSLRASQADIEPLQDELEMLREENRRLRAAMAAMARLDAQHDEHVLSTPPDEPVADSTPPDEPVADNASSDDVLESLRDSISRVDAAMGELRHDSVAASHGSVS